VLEGDALDLNWHQTFHVSHFTFHAKIIGNFPYQITSPLIEKALQPPLPAVIVFLVQKEVADRVTAAAGSKAYGALSVGVQSVAAPGPRARKAVHRRGNGLVARVGYAGAVLGRGDRRDGAARPSVRRATSARNPSRGLGGRGHRGVPGAGRVQRRGAGRPHGVGVERVGASHGRSTAPSNRAASRSNVTTPAPLCR